MSALLDRLRTVDLVTRTGRVTRILPTYIEADGPAAPLGALCRVASSSADEALAEVVSIGRDTIVLAPLSRTAQTFAGARVTACRESDAVPVGDGFLGRAVDALGRPIDGKPPVRTHLYAPLKSPAPPPLSRTTPRRMLETGVRTIDCLLTLGPGQRVGVFAASGVGKTSLMNQLARQVAADRCVVCLVGERGREVEAFWSDGLSDEAKARTTLVAATSDEAAALRVRAGDYALALADHWRSQGASVLLLMDSVTRLAMALREVGLAAGEPPTVRAYTPSVFAAIPRLVERCGAVKGGGSITAVMTVLTETDDADDPIAEMMRSLLDGHIVLSRTLAEQGHFPAIDTPRSISRLAPDIVSAGHRALAERALEQLSVFEASRTLVETGLYAKGANPKLDEALDHRDALTTFLRQPRDRREPVDRAWQALAGALGGSV